MQNNSKGNVRKLTSEYMEKQSKLQEYNQRRRKGLARRLTVFGTFIALFFIFIGYTLYNQQNTLQEIKSEKQEVEERLLFLKNEEVKLEEEIVLLQDPEYIAEIARRDFYLTKPGETLFQLPRSSSSSD
ncbi:septum formation initiator family protein [Evansella sp. AB-rgal1]|uniref:FtsB family cell division protein n=1 Tax=Evansella sp. AB-rgal1 TaxID=3242696 RepID=UPI00359CCB31